MLRCAMLSDGSIGGEQQVLIWGDVQDLRVAADGFRDWASLPEIGEVAWLPGEIRLVAGKPAAGMAREGDRLIWTIAPSDALRFAELLHVLIDSETPGHQYLDIDVAEAFGIEVKVSKGEYLPTFAG
jgi:hypothetical protein